MYTSQHKPESNMATKQIKIAASSLEKIKALVASMHGKSTAHTFSAEDILVLAATAERKLEAFGLTKAEMVGARISFYSGDEVPNSYKWTREGSVISIERRSTGWFIMALAGISLHKKPAKDAVVLTAAQDDAVVRRIRQQYAVC